MQNRPQTCSTVGEKPCISLQKDTGSAEWCISNPVLVVFLRAVLLKECVGTKPDTLLGKLLFVTNCLLRPAFCANPFATIWSNRSRRGEGSSGSSRTARFDGATPGPSCLWPQGCRVLAAHLASPS